MSGHSKWANIRVKKTAQDAARGKVFTKHAKLIEIAARAQGGDPNNNHALRNAIENARAENVPNANIERAIKKGMGEGGGSQMEEVLYACYLPGSVACLIECLTDNRNRTIANLRGIIEKNGGKWANVGSVAFLFERVGTKYLPKQCSAIPDEATTKKIADFIELLREDEDVSEVFTNFPIA
ncbi:YebC/PmpR family DNA-binding transcriptional regulator [Candidatus Peregrinibacteria bacterium]|nr:YebC/PmpR family DNA-binding transcriptional regulator [Candidatus Peregrinibacteria bacterium]